MAPKRKKLTKIMSDTLKRIDPNSLSIRKKIRLLVLAIILMIGCFAYFSNDNIFQADSIEISKPTIHIANPQPNAYIQSKQLTIKAKASGDYEVKNISLYVDGKALTSILGNQLDYTWKIPNSIEKGAHRLTIEAVDHLNNKNSKTIIFYYY